MNREIKFRGKRVNGGEWVYGMTISNGTIKRKINNIFFEVAENKWVGVLPETIGQYTGLKDKNGKEIYEGDILRLTGSTSNLAVEVVYNEEDTSFILKLTSINEVGARTLGSWLSLGYECAIIGNVYDNPKMVKGGSNEA